MPGETEMNSIITRILWVLKAALVLAVVAWAAEVPRLAGLQLFVEQYLAGVLALVLSILLLTRARETGPTKLLWALAAAASFVALLYLAWVYPTVAIRMGLLPPDLVVACAITVVASIVGLWIGAGMGIVVVVGVFVLYGLFGNLLPGVFGASPVTADELALYLGADPNAILGTPLRVASTIVIPFILFGRMLSTFGAGDFFTDIASAFVGRYRGGPAKVAVVASALFGTVSGSAVGNVVATGVVTIPLMKRAGYRPEEAGAIEAVASTGGQLVPPVLGATAFLVAEFLAIPYTDVVLASLIPGFIYFFALFCQVDLIAAKDRRAGLEADAVPPAGATFAAGWHFLLPFAALFWGLFWLHMEPEVAALIAIAVLVVVGFVRGYHGKRPSFPVFLRDLVNTGAASAEIVAITAGAGIVIGVLNLTGMAFGLTLNLVNLSGGNLAVLLVLAALINIVLGMGMPTVGIYVLLATLIAPSLVKLGVGELPAHMFILYFGLMSMLTPPVALAAFAGANVAQAPPWRTSMIAVRLGWSAYIVPFLFVLAPTLLMIGDPWMIAFAAVTATLGVYAVSVGIIGFFGGDLGTVVRVAMVVLGLGALLPAGAVPHGMLINAISVAGLMLLGLLLSRRKTSVPA